MIPGFIIGYITYGRPNKPKQPKIDSSWANERMLAIVLVLVGLVIGYFVWEYVREWRKRKAFKRYWESRRRESQRVEEHRR